MANRKLARALRPGGLFLACSVALTCVAQSNPIDPVHVDLATNIDCGTAIPLCKSTAFTYESVPEGVDCLWFLVTLQEENAIYVGTNNVGASDDGAFFRAAIDVDACTCPSSGGGDLNVTGDHDPGDYYIIWRLPASAGPHTLHILLGEVFQCDPVPCENCLPSFSLIPGEAYVVSAWVKKENAPAGTFNYGALTNARPRIRLHYPPVADMLIYPTMERPVVEGWQLMEMEFEYPIDATEFSLALEVESGSAFFDDVRLFPADGSMKCYVYDPDNLRFSAELDERHYATFYEYDNEGKLVRVKKETERGIMTIQESRQNASHTNP